MVVEAALAWEEDSVEEVLADSEEDLELESVVVVVVAAMPLALAATMEELALVQGSAAEVGAVTVLEVAIPQGEEEVPV